MGSGVEVVKNGVTFAIRKWSYDISSKLELERVCLAGILLVLNLNMFRKYTLKKNPSCSSFFAQQVNPFMQNAVKWPNIL